MEPTQINLTQISLEETFRRAAKVVETQGFTKRIRHDEKGRVCMLGALESALGMWNGKWHDFIQPSHPAVIALATYIPSTPKGRDGLTCKIVDWNDSPAVTAQDVIAKFLLAAHSEALRTV